MSWCDLDINQAEYILNQLQEIKVLVVDQENAEHKKQLKKSLAQILKVKVIYRHHCLKLKHDRLD